jgi:hypothetical protein
MSERDFESTYFSYFRRIDGSLQSAGRAKRNGRVVPTFAPSALEPEAYSAMEESSEYKALKREVLYNLTPCEQRTLERRADGVPVSEIAKEEGVSRAAIRKRILAMISKNEYMEISSRHGILKRKKNQHE